MDGDRPLTAKEKRQEQIKRWENSATDLECDTYTNPKVKVKFDDGAVFLAACSSGDLAEVGKLLKRGADINFANVDGLTALHQACIDGNLDVVKFLVQQGSEIDQEDNEGWTPLHATASCGFMDIAKFLVEYNANVGAVNSEGELPIDIAEEDDMIEYLQSEIDKQGIDVEDARNIEHHVMLEDANILLDSCQKGGEVEVYRHPKSGATSLHITAAKGYNDVLKILIQAGLDVNLQDNDGWTPLHAASHWSQEESAKVLSDKGANFKARSKLGQTPFDVADEDMLEYLNELEAEQPKNGPNIKQSQVIEPPPLENRYGEYKKSTETVETNKIKEGEKISESVENSLDKSNNKNSSVSQKTSNSETSSAAVISQEKEKSELTSNDVTKTFQKGRQNRPSSLHMTQDTSHSQNFSTEKSDVSSASTKPVAATQPVQSVVRGGENGSKSSSFHGFSSKDSKLNSPSAWRSGLRKTGSFEEKNRPPLRNSLSGKSEMERSPSYSSRFNDINSLKSENARTARVKPILDARQIKSETGGDDPVNDITGYQRSTPIGRRKYGIEMEDSPALPNENDTKPSDTSDTAAADATLQDDSASVSKTADKRRSHLQPVRDEEAEAQRRARSRRERQTRRSTQGVTLDVVEEALRTIGKRRPPQSSEKSSGDSTEGSKGDLYRRLDNESSGSSSLSQQGFSSSNSASSGTPVTSLPSGYIPSDQRVKLSASDSPGSGVPSINIQDTPDQDAKLPLENDSSSTSAPKSAALLRRRNRKERRSTGLPDLKPSSSAAENDGGEEDAENKQESSDTLNAERLRETAAKYESTSLPDRHGRHRSSVRETDTDPSSKSVTDGTGPAYSSIGRNSEKHYKELYEENQIENELLRGKVSDMQSKIDELQARLGRAEDNTMRRQVMDMEKKEKRALERKIAEMEKELQNSEGAEALREKNSKLEAENTALLRIVEKLGGGSSLRETRSATNDSIDSSTRHTEANIVTDHDDSSLVSEKPSDYIEEGLVLRRPSASSLTDTDVKGSRVDSLRSEEVGRGLSSTLDPTWKRGRPKLESSSSSPSLYTRSYSPRRTAAKNYSALSDYSPTSYLSNSYKSKKDASSSGSYTIPVSASRREFLRSLSPARTMPSRTSSLRSTPATYSSQSKSSLTSRPRQTYSSSSSLSGSKPSLLSKYSSGRRLMKY